MPTSATAILFCVLHHSIPFRPFVRAVSFSPPMERGCGLSHEIATALKDADQHVGRACAVLQDHALEAMGSWPVEVKLQMLQSCPWAWPESPAVLLRDCTPLPPDLPEHSCILRITE